jgi:hypothetical protein
MVSAGLIVPFSYMRINISTIFTLSLCPDHLSLVLTCRQNLFYLPALHFWKIDIVYFQMKKVKHREAKEHAQK